MTRLAVLALCVCACGISKKDKHHDSTKQSYSFDTAQDFKWSSIASTSATLEVKGGSTTTAELTVEMYAPDDTTPTAGQVSGKVFQFGPTGTTFDPPAVLTLPLDSAAPADAVLATSEFDAAGWTVLESARSGATLTAPVSHFSLFAVVSGLGPVDAGRMPMCSGDITATCAIMANGGHTCTEQHGTLSDAMSNCVSAGGTYSTGATPCPHTNVIGRCEHDSSGGCGLAYYFSDGLTLSFAKLQCEAGAGLWAPN